LLQPIIDSYKNLFKLIYVRNDIALGTPANWNFAISKANGDWIKLMHNDDWFAKKSSLEVFAAAALGNNANFIFSGFSEIKNDTIKKEYIISAVEKKLLKRTALNLFKKNFIGPPSTTLIKNDHVNWYDTKVKWVVDFEFYIRCLKQTVFFSINEPLINIGIHDDQVTKHVFGKPEIEIPENIYLLNKIGVKSLDNIFVYDYYWRLFRNLSIRTIKEVSSISNTDELPSEIIRMLIFQFKIPLPVLRIGLFSKCFMMLAKMF